jgi:hypothetical protein
LVRALGEFEDSLSRHRIAIEDLRLSAAGRHAAPFVLREGWIIVLGGPLAIWGALNHWIPFHSARWVSRRSVESAVDPAMRTIVAGAALVLLFYAAQGVAVAMLFGWVVAVLYLVSLPLAADVNFALRERLRAAVRRARTYLLFRRRPKLQERLQTELEQLTSEALEIEHQLIETRIAASAH